MRPPGPGCGRKSWAGRKLLPLSFPSDGTLLVRDCGGAADDQGTNASGEPGRVRYHWPLEAAKTARSGELV